MAYTAVCWRIPGEVLTGQYISMVRVYNCALVDEQNNIIYINVMVITSINSNI